ncbi:cupin domain-containing protein [Fluoribacter dumoffii]|uniref:Cupin domain n=1 Tax=Fluoribacter dumoffii TaxID=463 RepID=A0A377GEP2_9GAMM|nr:cupin domain-containing protein [Fluoribacter dumoffii]KTC91272.1 Cupin domain protein [Fluoribacter dumoffii NY 23]MCW8387559.1 cupin domain-containing protein [Fluoribacter dumoffii]MCW8497762.1 cupin domain-containing protein [Fluoribacter dumoffii]STO22971.1 Cupin domain [Fluoribacter dumoffii]
MNKTTQYTLVSIFAGIVLLLSFSSSVFAQCQGNAEPFESGTAKHEQWKSIGNSYSKSKRQAVLFNNFKGGIAKLPAGHNHPPHFYKHKLLVVVMEGTLHLHLNGKTTTYSKGEYFILPAYTCFSSHSKHGATVVMVGAKPGDSFPSKQK